MVGGGVGVWLGGYVCGVSGYGYVGEWVWVCGECRLSGQVGGVFQAVGKAACS